VHKTQHPQEIDIHTPGGIQTHNPRKRVAADPHLRPRESCDRLLLLRSYNVTEITTPKTDIINRNKIYSFYTIPKAATCLASS